MDISNEINTYELSAEECIALIPDEFYKYSKIDANLKTNLKNNTLWFNKLENFNDPFECKTYLDFGESTKECRDNFMKFNADFGVEYPKEHMDFWNDLLKIPKDFNNLFSFGTMNNFSETIGVSCFSENYNSTLMWAHYADSHKGIVLQFKKISNGFLTANLLPVVYYESYPKLKISEIKQGQMQSMIYKAITAKGKDWEYEKEWRAITDYGCKVYSFDKEELTGIIFGLNTCEKDKKEIYELIHEAGYSNISFRQAEFQIGKFVVEYNEYDPLKEEE